MLVELSLLTQLHFLKSVKCSRTDFPARKVKIISSKPLIEVTVLNIKQAQGNDHTIFRTWHFSHEA